MGVPALFRWLADKYPKVTTTVVEEEPRVVDGEEIPIDWSAPNPNGLELDNLYLDMNGIIHPCSHPEDKPAPSTEDEMYQEIFLYIDRIMTMMRPRKLVYMAIDGVAPRAKMNQQRSRRFRAAQEASERHKEEEKLRQEWTEQHPDEPLPEKLDADGNKAKAFDSNCITPGTPFMTNLAVALRYYIADRMQTSHGWKNLKVILSDAASPGEGEHKIMHYIRHQRMKPTHDPNTTHVLYGLDADLIMLALATHEPHFRILREDVFANEKIDRNKCFICGQEGHQAVMCQGKAKIKDGEFDEKRTAPSRKPYVFLHVPILREYLDAELSFAPGQLAFEWNLERAIDDWVFLVFFVGNDFLPHLPSLEIREGAIDTLVTIWKKVLPKLGGFLTKNGEVRLERIEQVLYELGKIEADIFQRRRDKELRRMANEKRRKEESEGRTSRPKPESGVPEIASHLTKNFDSLAYATPVASTQGRGLLISGKSAELSMAQASNSELVAQKVEMRAKANQSAAAALRAKLGKRKEPEDEREEPPLKRSASAPMLDDSLANVDASVDASEGATPVESAAGEDAEDEDDDDDVEESMTVADVPIPHVDKPDLEPHDEVRLWETGWKQRYYQSKFSVDEDDMGKRRDVVRHYVEGFCWVLKYYYQGVQSWKWFFPEHYAPFASDFTDLEQFDPVTFELGTPFKPFEQLMGVLPAASRWHIPETYHPLMLEDNSPILDFYPDHFEIDLNGKRHAWQGVALLPFIDESRLLKAMEPKTKHLTVDEEARNAMGDELLFVGEAHPMFDLLSTLYKDDEAPEETMSPIRNPKLYHLAGDLYPDPLVIEPGAVFHSPLASVGLPDVRITCISAAFLHPELPNSKYEFKADLLPGVKFPARVLNQEDIQRVRFGGGRGGFNNRGGYINRGGFNDRGGSPNFRGRGRGDSSGYYSDRNGYRNDRGSFHQAPQHSRPSGGGLFHSVYNQRPERPAHSDPYQQLGFAQPYGTMPPPGFPLPTPPPFLPPAPGGWHPGAPPQPYPQIYPPQQYPPQQYPPQQYQQAAPGGWHTNPAWVNPNVPRPSQHPRPNLAWNRNLSNQR